jgi:protein-S-isoprenylcysteine O-methyltransferase Ste14
MTFLKTILFLLLVPGLLMGVFPVWLIHTDMVQFSFGVFHWLANPMWLIGIPVLLWCAWAFTVRGHGTPSPTDPPRVLVTSGLYHYVHNPIYLSVVPIFMGYALWHPSRALLACPLLVALSSHLFVMYEEPH